MPDPAVSSQTPAKSELQNEIVRLNKVVMALMNRAECNTGSDRSEFNIFQTGILLDRQVRQRTVELEEAFRENQRVFRALKDSEARFRGLANQSLVGISIIEDGRCTYANPRLAEIYGYTVEQMLELDLCDVVAKEDQQGVQEQIERRFRGETLGSEFRFRGLRQNGAIIEIESHSTVMEIGGKPLLISMMLDITERMKAERALVALEEKLREQAVRDPLTGLYNRQSLNEFFDRELSLASRRHLPVSIVLADLDHFKRVNDTHGHQAGDDALCAFADMVHFFCRSTDLICRWGGEEFLFVMPDMAIETACRRMESMRKMLETTEIDSDSGKFRITSSFGVAVFPENGETHEQLIAAADRALYHAKNSGRNRIECYTTEMAGRV